MTLLDGTRVATIAHDLASTSGTYTVDFTRAGLGASSSMRAIIVETGRGTTYGTAVNGIGKTLGISDGTTHRMVAIRSQMSVGTTDTAYRAHTDAVGVYMDDSAGTSLLEIDFSSWITDGVRLSFTQTAGTPPAGAQVHVTIIAGPDVSAEVIQTQTHATTGTAVTVSPSYSTETSFVLCLAHGTFDTVADGERTGAMISWGCAVNDASDTNGCVVWGTTDNVATSDPYCDVRTDRCMQTATSTALGGGAVIDNFQSNGDYDLTGEVIGTKIVAMLAVSMPESVALENATLLGSAGPFPETDASTTPGFRPQAMIGCATAMTVSDSLNTSNPSGTFGTFFGAIDASGDVVVYGHAASEANGQATTDNQAVFGDQTNGIEIPFHLGADASIFRIDSFDATGYTLEYDDAPPVGRKAWILTIEESDLLGVFDEDVEWTEEVVTATTNVVTVDEDVLLAETLSFPLQPQIFSESLLIEESAPVFVLTGDQGVLADTIPLQETVRYVKTTDNPPAELRRVIAAVGSNATSAATGGSTRPRVRRS